jgi:hypothetical protein
MLGIGCYGVSGNNRVRNNSALAQQYIMRMSVLRRLIWPSVRPLLQGSAIALPTASMSCHNARANRRML